MKRDKIKYIILVFITLTACALLFVKTDLCAAGIKEGLILCAGTVIPSLFPFMVVSQFILKSGLADFLGSMLGSVTERIFRQPGITAGVILMSLIGGFPVGAKMTADLLGEGKITENQAQRLNLFCINAGPAFIIGTVGSMFLGTRKAGVILYASTCIASLFTGMLTRIIADREQAVPHKDEITYIANPVTAFSQATADSAKTMLSICAWIVIFNAVIKCISSFGNGLSVIIACSLLEVTSGIKLSLGVLPFPVIAAVLSFGGLSVHCQIYSFISKSRLNMRYFYLARIITAAISSLICTGLIKIFPCEISTFHTNSQILPAAYSISVPAAVALIFMCAVLIFEVDTDKKTC